MIPDVYLVYNYVSKILSQNKKAIAEQFKTIGTAAYVGGIMEMIKGNFASIDTWLLFVIGMTFIFIASKITCK